MLRREILSAMEDGSPHFISGFAAGADLLFAEIVNELKASYSISLETAIPYPGRMKTPDKTFQRLIRCCDVVKIHTDVYFKDCYMRRNCCMVDQSQRVIAVCDGCPTGAAATVWYGKEKEMRFIRLGFFVSQDVCGRGSLGYGSNSERTKFFFQWNGNNFSTLTETSPQFPRNGG